MILCIETSTDVCSVALTQEDKVLKSIEYEGTPAHASRLTPMIQDLLKAENISPKDLDAVAVSSGPGSYTGLRIGASTAKGIAYATGKKLIAVPTLSIIAHTIFQSDPDCQCACPMIDARRMEVYTTIVTRNGQTLLPTQALIINENSFGTELATNKITFAGNGSDKCQGVITSPSAKFISGIKPLAKNMAQLAAERLASDQTENVAYFEPFYLKDFIATTPKNKVLNF